MAHLTRKTRKLSRLADKELALNFIVTEWQAAYILLDGGTGKVVNSLIDICLNKIERTTVKRDKVRSKLLKMTKAMNLHR